MITGQDSIQTAQQKTRFLQLKLHLLGLANDLKIETEYKNLDRILEGLILKIKSDTELTRNQKLLVKEIGRELAQEGGPSREHIRN